MFATAATNLALALLASDIVRSWFIAVVPLATKIVLVLTQYGVTRRMVSRHIAVARAVAVPAS